MVVMIYVLRDYSFLILLKDGRGGIVYTRKHDELYTSDVDDVRSLVYGWVCNIRRPRVYVFSGNANSARHA